MAKITIEITLPHGGTDTYRDVEDFNYDMSGRVLQFRSGNKQVITNYSWRVIANQEEPHA
jgi:hypothetical protein